jgi:hypothetical protein
VIQKNLLSLVVVRSNPVTPFFVDDLTRFPLADLDVQLDTHFLHKRTELSTYGITFFGEGSQLPNEIWVKKYIEQSYGAQFRRSG